MAIEYLIMSLCFVVNINTFWLSANSRVVLAARKGFMTLCKADSFVFWFLQQRTFLPQFYLKQST